MSSIRTSDRQTGRMIVVIAVLAATIVSSFLPALAWAAQVTERSIALSTSAQDATSVSYQFNFTATQAAGAFVAEFCSNTPLIGEDCTPPTGFDATDAASADGDVVSIDGSTNKVIVETAMTAAEQVSIDVTTIDNPTVVGELYARIVTYDTVANATAQYTSTSLGANAIDEGGVALYITNEVNVSGAVLETLTFCVSGGQDAANPLVNPITADCGGTHTAPTLRLGKDTAGVIALDSSDVWEGTIFTQLSTNAAKGVVVSLKSDAADCGGLLRSSDTTACDIGPAGTTGDIDNGEALFGVKLGTAALTDPEDGDLRPAAGSAYTNTAFRLNYVDANSGVTSTYGDPILDTNSKPANNRDMPLVFGASVTNNTPAGNYSAILSLIATGKF